MTEEAPSLPALGDREWSLLIGGRLMPARSGRHFSDESPVTEDIIATVPDGDAADVGAAVEAALPAAATWRRVPPRERGALVGELARVLEENAHELAIPDALHGRHPVPAMRLELAL